MSQDAQRDSTCSSSGVAVWNSFMAPATKPIIARRPLMVSGAGPLKRIASAWRQTLYLRAEAKSIATWDEVLHTCALQGVASSAV